MTFTPGWCAGWFFVPIMNLFRPYQAVKEIYQASDPECGPHDWQGRGAGLVGLWWALWIISNILDSIESRIGQMEDPQALLVSCWVGVFGSAMGVLLCVAVAKVVRSIQSRQLTKARRVGAL